MKFNQTDCCNREIPELREKKELQFVDVAYFAVKKIRA